MLWQHIIAAHTIVFPSHVPYNCTWVGRIIPGYGLLRTYLFQAIAATASTCFSDFESTHLVGKITRLAANGISLKIVRIRKPHYLGRDWVTSSLFLPGCRS